MAGVNESIIRAELTPAHAGWRLDRALADALPTLSREACKRLIAAGGVTADGAPLRDPARKVTGREVFDIRHEPPRDPAARAQDIAVPIVYQDEHLLVVDKPAGLVVHPAAGNLDGTLVNALLHLCAGQLSGIGGVARPGIVHRIDKDTSGLLVVAKTDRAHTALAGQFAAHRVHRRYLAVVSGVPTHMNGTVTANLARSAANRLKMAVVESGRGKTAITHWRRDTVLDRASVVECRLETGRTHQVRVHMAHIGHPLLGDPFYGRRGPHDATLAGLDFHRQALHAAELGFEHPVSKEKLAFTSVTPGDMQALIGALSV